MCNLGHLSTKGRADGIDGSLIRAFQQEYTAHVAHFAVSRIHSCRRHEQYVLRACKLFSQTGCCILLSTATGSLYLTWQQTDMFLF